MIKSVKLLSVTLLISLLCYSAVNAQTTAKEMASKMHPGINLGNTFDAHGYEGAWAPATTEKDFIAFKDAGFACVRIPITWHCGMAKDDETLRFSSEKPFKVNDDFFKRLDEVVNWSLENGLITVINAHHDTWVKQTEAFDGQKERFYSLWKQVAKHYKDYPETLLFEVINEPHHESAEGKDDGLTVAQVDELNKTSFEIIRKTNPTRVVIYSGRGWGGLYELVKATPPSTTDKYVMATYHSYGPWDFAGEGNGSWGTEKDFKDMDSEFEQAKAYSEKFNIPVYIGEYGAQHQCKYNARMIHYAHYIENIQKYDVAATAWDDAGYRFKLYDRESEVWDDAKDVITNYTTTSANNLKLTILDGYFVKVDWENRAENIEKITIERRISREGGFEKLETVDACESYTDKSDKQKQHNYYYRVVNHLSNGEKLISYPQQVYLP